MHINTVSILSRLPSIEIEIHLLLVEGGGDKVAVVEGLQLVIMWSENIVSGVLSGVDFRLPPSHTEV
jgi:hypothetical protein